MKLKQLFNDDDAVSPVIGVILMVAITVILVAVIAAFVLGLGDTADEVQPTTSFDFDWDTELDNDGDVDEVILTITLTDGDTVEYGEMFLRGDGVAEDDDDSIDEAADDDDLDSDDTWSTGSSVSFTGGGDDIWDDGEPGDSVNLVWDTGDDSSTLDSTELPDDVEDLNS